MKKTLHNSIMAVGLLIGANTVYAADTILDTYYTPSKSGIVWVSVSPSFIDYRKYSAEFKVVCNGKTKKIKVNKSSSHPVVIGVPHWENSTTKVTVLKPSWWFGSNDTSIINIKQGDKPSDSYQTSLHINDFSC